MGVVIVFLDYVGSFSGFDPIKVKVALFEVLIHVGHEFFSGNEFPRVRFSIDVDNFVLDLYGVSGNADDSFDVFLVRFARVFENDDIPSLRVFFAEQVDGGVPADVENPQGEIRKIRIGHFESVREFVDQDEVSDHQGGDHGAGGNAEGFEKSGAEGEDHHENDEDGLGFFDKLLSFGQSFWCFHCDGIRITFYGYMTIMLKASL